MEFLSNLWQQVSRIFGRLTPSQRVTFALLVAMIVGSLVLLTALAGRTEWVPISAGGMSADQIATAMADLDKAGIAARETGGRLEVKTADRYRAVAALGESGSLPAKGGFFGFNELVGQSGGIGNIKTSDQRRIEQQVALQTELQRTLAEFRGVRGARVLLSEPSRRTFDFGRNRPRKASAILWLEPGMGLSSHTVRSVANLVAYSVTQLQPANVAVIDAERNVVCHVPADEGMFPVGQLERKREAEKYLTGKLLDAFAFIQGKFVGVSVLLRPQTEKKLSTTIDPTSSVVPRREKTRTERTDSGVTTGAGGATSGTNGGVTVAAPAAAGRVVEEEEIEELGEAYSKTTIDAFFPAGEIERLTASIVIPTTYYRNMAAETLEEGQKPDDAAVTALASHDTDRIRKIALGVLGPKAKPEDVTVDVRYVPTEPVTAAAWTAGAGGPGGIGQLMQRYGTTAVLAGLALTFMFLLSRWVKRPAAAGADATVATAGTSPLTPADGEPVVLPDGTERSMEERRLEEMRKRIEDMARQDPSNAANLVARWLGQG